MKKITEKRKLSLNKKTIQYLTNTGLLQANGGATNTCTVTCFPCDPTTGGTMTPQTYCIGGTTVTISGCNKGQ